MRSPCRGVNVCECSVPGQGFLLEGSSVVNGRIRQGALAGVPAEVVGDGHHRVRKDTGKFSFAGNSVWLCVERVS